ncbi:hypothetical protein EBZ80_15445 [bacterium]|nr:hypothetical protein [bacterium]
MLVSSRREEFNALRLVDGIVCVAGERRSEESLLFSFAWYNSVDGSICGRMLVDPNCYKITAWNLSFCAVLTQHNADDKVFSVHRPDGSITRLRLPQPTSEDCFTHPDAAVSEDSCWVALRSRFVPAYTLYDARSGMPIRQLEQANSTPERFGVKWTAGDPYHGWVSFSGDGSAVLGWEPVGADDMQFGRVYRAWPVQDGATLPDCANLRWGFAYAPYSYNSGAPHLQHTALPYALSTASPPNIPARCVCAGTASHVVTWEHGGSRAEHTDGSVFTIYSLAGDWAPITVWSACRWRKDALLTSSLAVIGLGRRVVVWDLRRAVCIAHWPYSGLWAGVSPNGAAAISGGAAQNDHTVGDGGNRGGWEVRVLPMPPPVVVLLVAAARRHPSGPALAPELWMDMTVWPAVCAPEGPV